ncbi:hypothetical protein [Streptomyces sp. NPDC096153]|uniref:hypothetical protein n=1 Tax=Streptomyces sp. NPDC096153 TaxID=3155548 RepID=UPI0033261014
MADEDWAAPSLATSCVRIEAIAERLLQYASPVIAFSLSGNPSLPVAALAELSHHDQVDVRRNVARRVGERFAAECDGLMEVAHKLIMDPDPAVRIELVRVARVPDQIRVIALEDPEESVREVLARAWINPSRAHHFRLLNDESGLVRSAACSPCHPSPPQQILESFIENPQTRAAAICHITLTEEMASRMICDLDPEVRSAFAAHPQIPQAAAEELASDVDGVVISALAMNEEVSEAIRNRACTKIASEKYELSMLVGFSLIDNSWADRSLFPRLRATVGEVWDRYIDSPFPWVRKILASESLKLPMVAVQALLRDPDPEVQVIAASCADTISSEDLKRIVAENGEGGKIRHLTNCDLTDREEFPVEALEQFGRSTVELRKLAARVSRSENLLGLLARDTDPAVRARTAQNPHVSRKDLAALLMDNNSSVAVYAGMNPSLPEEWIEEMIEGIG